MYVRFYNLHACTPIWLITTMIIPLYHCTRVDMTFTFEQEELSNLCKIQAMHTILVRVGVDKNRVIKRAFLPPYVCCTNMFWVHTTYITQIIWGEVCGDCRRIKGDQFINFRRSAIRVINGKHVRDGVSASVLGSKWVEYINKVWLIYWMPKLISCHNTHWKHVNYLHT